MEMNHFTAVTIDEGSQVAEGRRLAQRLAVEAGFSETDAGKVAIAATEVATNMVKHGGGGELLVRSTALPNGMGMEMVALDKGPGMSRLEECMRDGFSTAGSPGTGLGAIHRQSSFMDVYTFPGRGTALFMQFLPKPASSISTTPFEWGGVAVPMRGETECGDGWAVSLQQHHLRVMICDGLGHGVHAAEAARSAIRSFSERWLPGVAACIQSLHQALRSTRGAAVAVMEMDAAGTELRYCGVGNTAACVVQGVRVKQMVSHNGTLGHHLPRLQEFTYSWPDEALVVLTTDGLMSQWNLEKYPGLALRHPTLIAGVLYRDFQRGRDDTTVVVVKRRHSG